MTNLKHIKRIDKQYLDALSRAGVCNVEQLLDRGATPIGRLKLADQTSLTVNQIEEFVHLADMTRINGLSGEIASLFCSLGICTVPKLAYCNPEQLHRQVANTLADEHKEFIVPSKRQIIDFIAHAKDLPKIIWH